LGGVVWVLFEVLDEYTRLFERNLGALQ
jgi:hypothetical protein